MPYKEDISGVYCLRAADCGFIYTGSSKDIKHRYSVHISSNLFEREQYWIGFYKNQSVWKLVNVFDADREDSSVPDSFRNKMSLIRKEKWKDEEYRKSQLKRLEKNTILCRKIK